MAWTPNPRNALPLTETAFFILLSLAGEPKHGYAIMKEVKLISRGRIDLSTGTLYGAAKRMLSQRWIEQVGETEERNRKAYALTDFGREILAAEIERMEGLVSLADGIIQRGV